ncbi:MAG: RsmE family RNA methyltransferase, partial [Candidatus Latescibacteria bacterium]|nr:RsmE family RNA methyltransferase [Candidatus Latescibacterota bacterium]
AEKNIKDIKKRITGSQAVTLIVGPEGDFTDEERDMILTGGALPVSLGGLTLKSETAAIAATALAVCAMEKEC